MPSDETSNSPISQNLLTCRSNGSTIRPTLLPISSRSPGLNKTRTVDEQLLVEDGMTTDVLIHPPIATTYTSALSVPIQDTLPAAAPLQTRNRVEHPDVRWERHPRFIRDFVWSDVNSQDSTTALVSELAPPVPQPPQNKLLSKEKWDFIKSHPHLFRITTPINVDRFGSLLASHPNQTLVKSVCEGLCSGFWPWAITENLDALSIVDNAVLQKVKNQDHLNFMRNQRDEEIKLSRFSDTFKSLLPGMMTIPLWVVPKPHADKFQLVVDHSAGNYSPNLYISPDDASVHLDTLHVLGKVLTRVRNQHGFNVPLVLFKTDVLQAYRRVPMHPLWQLRQVVTIQGYHHVDNNNNFGNRGAGMLWVTFLALLFGSQFLSGLYLTSLHMLTMPSLGSSQATSCIIRLSGNPYQPNRLDF